MIGWRAKLGVGAALVGFMVTGCNLLLDIGRSQCESDLECERRGGEFEGSMCVDGFCRSVALACEGEACDAGSGCPAGGCDAAAELGCIEPDDCAPGVRCADRRCQGAVQPAWACLQKPMADRVETVVVTVPVTTAYGDPVPDLPVRACWVVDSACREPEVETTTGADGLLELELPGGFAGYLEVEESDYYPLLYFLPVPLRSGAVLEPMYLSVPEDLVLLLEIIGVTADPARGHVSAFAKDCDGRLAGGLRFASAKADADAVPFYTVTAPSTDLTETAEGVGMGGFFNFPVGSAGLELVLDATGQTLASATVFVRAATSSQVQFDVAGRQ